MSEKETEKMKESLKEKEATPKEKVSEKKEEDKKESEKKDPEKEKKEKRKAFWKDFRDMLIYMGIVFVISVLIVIFIAQRTVVDGTSMNPTLNNGDNLIVSKITYKVSDPKRFDVVVFPYQHRKHTYYIKRIIGLPGETVYIDKDGTIYINGEVLEEDYGNATIIDPGRASEPITLGDDEYFVLGDNRNNSSDSRDNMVGNIKRKDFVGKAWLRIYPFRDFGAVPHAKEEDKDK